MTNPADVSKAVKPKKAPKVSMTLTKSQLRAVKLLSKAKARLKTEKEKVDRYDEMVRAALGDAEIGLTEDGMKAVEVMHSKNTRYDRQVLTTRFPEAAKSAYVETPYTFLNVL